MRIVKKRSSSSLLFISISVPVDIHTCIHVESCITYAYFQNHKHRMSYRTQLICNPKRLLIFHLSHPVDQLVARTPKFHFGTWPSGTKVDDSTSLIATIRFSLPSFLHRLLAGIRTITPGAFIPHKNEHSLTPGQKENLGIGVNYPCLAVSLHPRDGEMCNRND